MSRSIFERVKDLLMFVSRIICTYVTRIFLTHVTDLHVTDYILYNTRLIFLHLKDILVTDDICTTHGRTCHGRFTYMSTTDTLTCQGHHIKYTLRTLFFTCHGCVIVHVKDDIGVQLTDLFEKRPHGQYGCP